MRAANKTGNTKAERGGDTSRSSSQGRKLSSGGRPGKKGNPEIDETTHNPVAGSQKIRRIGERRKP